MKPFKIAKIDNGFCRITYKTKNDNNETIYYGLQEDFKDVVNVYRCSKDGEPSHQVKLKKPASELFERPLGDEQIEIAVRKFLDKKD